METIDYITPIKKQLDKKMHMVCNNFMLIGTRRETPRYYNLHDYESLSEGSNNSGCTLITISSTQNEALYFEVLAPVNYPNINWDEFWKQFKEYRTEFLFKNYPSIQQYGINLESYTIQDKIDLGEYKISEYDSNDEQPH